MTRTVILEELPHEELLAWALEAEQALDAISRLAAPPGSTRLGEIRALSNPWSRRRALAAAEKVDPPG